VSKQVKCVPGGHEVELDKAYWCNRCGFYICYKHAETSFLDTSVKCRKGHELSRAR
jgi:hypothetical protein